jgi:hypothetical protein
MAVGIAGREPSAGGPAPPRRAGIDLGVAVQRAVGLTTVLVVLGVLVAPRMSVNRYHAGAAAAALLGVVVAWLALAALPGRGRRWSDRRWDVLACLLCVLLTSIAGVFAYGGAYRAGWDVGLMKWFSGRPPGPEHVRYFSIYPNQGPFLAVARTVREAIAGTGMDYEGGFAVLNTVSFLVTVIAVYLTVRWVAGPARGTLALLVLGVLLGTTPWLSVAYTDMAALCAPVTAVALLTAAFGRSGSQASTGVLAAVGGVVLAAGYVLKVTPVVGLVALVVALAVAMTARDAPHRRLLTIGTSAGIAFLVAVPAFGAWVRATEDLPALHRDWAATPLTYVAAGFRTQTWTDGSTVYGAWDRTVVRETVERDTATQNAVARQLISEEWASRGLLGTLGFAADKTLFTWGDGTFWARSEGHDLTGPPLRQGAVADAVMAWNSPAGALFGLHVLLAQVTWTASLLGLGFGLLRARYRPEILLMALTVVGIAIFTLLFQGRSRYLLVHVPVVVALAACAVPRPRLRLVSNPRSMSASLPGRLSGGSHLRQFLGRRERGRTGLQRRSVPRAMRGVLAAADPVHRPL